MNDSIIMSCFPIDTPCSNIEYQADNASITTNDTIYSSFHFVTEKPDYTIETNIRNTSTFSPWWNMAIILITLLTIALNRSLAYNKFSTIIATFAQNKSSEKMLREWNPLRSISGTSVFICHIAMMSLYIQHILLIINNDYLFRSFKFYLTICCSIAVFLLFQYLMSNLYGWIINAKKAIQHHTIMRLSAASLNNLILIPMMLIIIFYPSKAICIITGIILFIPYIIRIVKIFFELQILTKLSYINIFLYLCTLEIAPLAVALTMAYRIVTSNCII